MRDLIVSLKPGFIVGSVSVTIPEPEPLDVAARRIAAKGIFIDDEGRRVVPPLFLDTWTYVPPGQIRAVRFRR